MGISWATDRRRRLGLRWHLAARVFLAVALAILALWAYNDYALRRALTTAQAARQHLLAREGLRLLGPRRDVNRLVRFLAGPQTAVWVFDRSGRFRGGLTPPALKVPPIFVGRRAAPGPPRGRAGYIVSHGLLLTADPLGPAGGGDIVEQAVRLDGVLAPAERAFVLFIFGGLAATALAVLLGLALTRSLVRSLRRLDETALRLAGGAYGERVAVPAGPAELGSLAESFNTMAGSIEKAFASEREARRAMREFVADASHELRTPLQALTGFIELLAEGRITEEADAARAWAAMRRESRRLGDLVADLLTLTRLDRKEPLTLEPVSLADLLEEVAESARPLTADHDFRLRIEDPGVLMGEGGELRRAIWNLLANALAHTPPGGRVVAAVGRRAGRIFLEVADSGAGIPPEDLPHIFTRFWRGDRARSGGGSGLGLSIVEAVTEAHGGTVAVRSEPGRGSTFVLSFPEPSGEVLRNGEGAEA